MSRYSAYNNYQPKDDAPDMAGDNRFIGVNMRLDPAQLPPGYASEAINMRFRYGIAESRKGLACPPWANKIVGTQIQPWGTVYGVGVFSDPFTLQEYLIIAADGSLFCTKANNAAFSITLPAGVTVSAPAQFTQAFDVMILHQGVAVATLQMPRISSGFDVVTQSNQSVVVTTNSDGTTTVTGNGTQTIPNAVRSLFFQNRLFIPKPNDEIAVSDYGDYTRYVPVAQEFKVNLGSADNVVNVAKFNDITLVVFKDHSIYVVNNIYGNLAAAQQDEITTQFGLVAPQSIAQVGNDLWFLSELGVMSLGQTQQNKLQSKVLPESDPIQPLIDRINWRYASASVAAYWDSKYYLAVPLDDAEIITDELIGTVAYLGGYVVTTVVGATYRYIIGGANDTGLTNGTEVLTRSGDIVAQGTTVTLNGTGGQLSTASFKRIYKGVNTAVLIYDFLNGAWAGYDTYGTDVKQFFQFTYNNQRRLFFISSDGWVKLMEENYEDQLSRPYADLTVLSVPVAGVDTLQVNGGQVITASNSATSNTSTQWGGQTLSAKQAFLFRDLTGNYGFSPGSAPPWTATNILAVPITGGVRLYGTNGVVPTIVTTGTWASVNEVNSSDVVASVTTRAYTSPQLDLSRFNYMNVDVQTWNPTYSLTALGAGVEQSTAYVNGQTRDRTAYYQPANAAAFDTTNTNNDFSVAYRQDYSLLLGPAGAVDFDLWSASGGVRLDYHQEVRHTERINQTGRAVRVKLDNTTGRIRLMAARLESDSQPLYAGTSA